MTPELPDNWKMLLAIKNVYSGSVSQKDKERRRKKNKSSRRARKK